MEPQVSAWRRNLLDWWTLYLAPWLPSWLPWRWAYPCYRWFARSACLHRERAVAAAGIAPLYVPVADRRAFMHDLRTVWLLDAADLALSRRGPVDRLPAHVTVEGSWPARGGFIAVGFHHAAALWAFHDLRRHGHATTMVLARLDEREFGADRVRYRYARDRIAELERVGGEACIHRPHARAKLLDALARGVAVISLIDVPPRLAPRGQQPVQLLGQPASLPVGALELACESGVPVVPFWVELDLHSGRRRLVIGAAHAPVAIDALRDALAALLDRLVRTQPAAWHMWQEWPAWLQAAAALHSAAQPSEA